MVQWHATAAHGIITETFIKRAATRACGTFVLNYA